MSICIYLIFYNQSFDKNQTHNTYILNSNLVTKSLIRIENFAAYKGKTALQNRVKLREFFAIFAHKTNINAFCYSF